MNISLCTVCCCACSVKHNSLKINQSGNCYASSPQRSAACQGMPGGSSSTKQGSGKTPATIMADKAGHAQEGVAGCMESGEAALQGCCTALYHQADECQECEGQSRRLLQDNIVCAPSWRHPPQCVWICNSCCRNRADCNRAKTSRSVLLKMKYFLSGQPSLYLRGP